MAGSILSNIVTEIEALRAGGLAENQGRVAYFLACAIAEARRLAQREAGVPPGCTLSKPFTLSRIAAKLDAVLRGSAAG